MVNLKYPQLEQQMQPDAAAGEWLLLLSITCLIMGCQSPNEAG